MRECSWGAWRESLPNTRNTQVYCTKVSHTLGKINAWTLAGRMARIIAKQKEHIRLLRKSQPNVRKNKNAWTLVERATRIIAKHEEDIGLLQKCELAIRKSKKYVNAHGRVATITSKHQEYIDLLWTCYPHIQTKNNKCANARGSRGLNHCQTVGIHMFIINMLLKH